MKADEDVINILPNKIGPHGRAWDIDIAAAVEKSGNQPNCMVAMWIVEAPWAHPLWHSYHFTLVHLRGAPGLNAPILHDPDASHEFLIHALQPDRPREPLIRGEVKEGEGWCWLLPTNFGAQLIEPDDASAMKRVEASIDKVMMGQLSPDTDFRQQWIALFGDNMMK